LTHFYRIKLFYL